MNRKLLTSQKEKATLLFSVKAVDQENYTVEGVFSTEIEDRHGEVVVQNGWKLDDYRSNPVVLWAHDAQSFPIAKMLDIAVNGQNQLAGKMQFAVKEYDVAATAFALITGGYLRAFSAGFMNNKYVIDQENEKVYLTENDLYEVSVVPIPANKLALAKEKGLDISAFEEKAAAADGDECKMPDGSMGEMHPDADGNMVCQMKKDAAPAVTLTQESVEAVATALAQKLNVTPSMGDACSMTDGTMGVMSDDGNGHMVCMPKSKSKQSADNASALSRKVETPTGKGGRGFNRKLNRTIRQLLALKQQRAAN